MNISRLTVALILVAIGTWLAVATPSQYLFGQEPPPQGQELLARGPIHEAFAQPIVFDAKAGTVVKKEPPKPIEEMPPAEKPEGDNVQWVSGYWAWDDDRG